MPEWAAPAKLNLDLRVRTADANGLHPLRSLVQTIDWCDSVVVEEGDEDRLQIEGADLTDTGDNLVWKAVEALNVERPQLDIGLVKRVPIAAGLGGGSSDAAAALAALAVMLRVSSERVAEVAASVGADVSFFLTGGTARMEGYGQRITPLDRLGGFAVAVVVPPFELQTAEVYGRWDRLDAPRGPVVSGRALPPALRDQELANDLLPAALDLRPELSDWMSDLGARWDGPVLMSGSGPACFGFFGDVDEAADALTAVRQHRASAAAELRDHGVARTEP